MSANDWLAGPVPCFGLSCAAGARTSAGSAGGATNACGMTSAAITTAIPAIATTIECWCIADSPSVTKETAPRRSTDRHKGHPPNSTSGWGKIKRCKGRLLSGQRSVVSRSRLPGGIFT